MADCEFPSQSDDNKPSMDKEKIAMDCQNTRSTLRDSTSMTLPTELRSSHSEELTASVSFECERTVQTNVRKSDTDTSDRLPESEREVFRIGLDCEGAAMLDRGPLAAMFDNAIVSDLNIEEIPPRKLKLSPRDGHAVPENECRGATRPSHDGSSRRGIVADNPSPYSPFFEKPSDSESEAASGLDVDRHSAHSDSGSSVSGYVPARPRRHERDDISDLNDEDVDELLDRIMMDREMREWHEWLDFMENPDYPRERLQAPPEPLYPQGEQIRADCYICLETTRLRRRLCCDFPVCDTCLESYLSVQVSQANVNIECLNIRCKSYIHRNEVSARLPAKMKSKFYKFLIDANVDPTIKTCPRCSFGLQADKAQLKKRRVMKHGLCVTCEKCRLEWCFGCHAPWHKGLTCRDFRKGDVLLRDWAREFHYGQLNAQKCPKCKIFIQRSLGCDHMTCNRCSTSFCYRCGESYRGIKLLGNHFSRYSPFGCRYNFMPDAPHLRRFIRGAVLSGKVIGGLALSGFVAAFLVGASLIALPAWGGYKLAKRRRRNRRAARASAMQLQRLNAMESTTAPGNEVTLTPVPHLDNSDSAADYEDSSDETWDRVVLGLQMPDSRRVEVLVHRAVGSNSDHEDSGNHGNNSAAGNHGNNHASGSEVVTDSAVVTTEVTEVKNDGGYTTVVANIRARCLDYDSAAAAVTAVTLDPGDSDEADRSESSGDNEASGNGDGAGASGERSTADKSSSEEGGAGGQAGGNQLATEERCPPALGHVVAGDAPSLPEAGAGHSGLEAEGVERDGGIGLENGRYKSAMLAQDPRGRFGEEGESSLEGVVSGGEKREKLSEERQRKEAASDLENREKVSEAKKSKEISSVFEKREVSAAEAKKVKEVAGSCAEKQEKSAEEKKVKDVEHKGKVTEVKKEREAAQGSDRREKSARAEEKKEREAAQGSDRREKSARAEEKSTRRTQDKEPTARVKAADPADQGQLNKQSSNGCFGNIFSRKITVIQISNKRNTSPQLESQKEHPGGKPADEKRDKQALQKSKPCSDPHSTPQPREKEKLTNRMPDGQPGKKYEKGVLLQDYVVLSPPGDFSSYDHEDDSLSMSSAGSVEDGGREREGGGVREEGEAGEEESGCCLSPADSFGGSNLSCDIVTYL